LQIYPGKGSKLQFHYHHIEIHAMGIERNHSLFPPGPGLLLNVGILHQWHELHFYYLSKKLYQFQIALPLLFYSS